MALDSSILPAERKGEFSFDGLKVWEAGATTFVENGKLVAHDLAHRPERIYSSYAGVDILAEIILPGERPMPLGELQTISYSIHRENSPVRILGHVNPAGFVKGPRTIAGSLIFTVFNYYAFYRLDQFKISIASGLYPLADMLPPFDVVLTFANEAGSMSKMKIYGITVVDEGQTMSVDDLITEQTYAYMARGIQPLTGFAVHTTGLSSAETHAQRANNAMAFNY